MHNIYTKLNNKPTKKITIFSIVKPFIGHIGVIQRNAIFSWTLLTPKPEIFLFGDEQGTKEICQELNLTHIPEVKRNKYNTPLLDGVFAETHYRASNDIIAYLNADIILTNDFSSSVQSVSEELDDYLLIGRRWNIDIGEELKFDLGWESSLKKLIQDRGCLADCDCKDYFVFPKHLFTDIPAFAVGRGYWDTWMVTQALADGCPVVDGSLVITAVHQNHPYTHIRGGRNEAYMGIEAQSNKTLGNVTQPGDIARATWQLKPSEYKDLPTVSIIIIVNEGCALVEKTISSILSQTYSDYEIIVIDKNYNRKINPALRPYKNKIRYFSLKRQDIDIYTCSLKLAQGELITFLEAGSVLLPEALRKQVKCFEKEASTLDILLSDRKSIDKNNLIESKSDKNIQNISYTNIESSKLIENFLDIYAVMFRKARLDNIKSFNSFLSKEAIKVFCSVSVEELKTERLALLTVIDGYSVSRIW